MFLSYRNYQSGLLDKRKFYNKIIYKLIISVVILLILFLSPKIVNLISSTIQNFSPRNYVKTAFWVICATGESCAKTMQEYSESINNSGGNAKYYTKPGGHMDTDCAFLDKEIIEWALNQEKK